MARSPCVVPDTDAVWAAIDRERLDLADLLDDLAPADWEQSSLCAVGEGALVEGTVQALLMVLTGRTGPVRDELSGPGADRLR